MTDQKSGRRYEMRQRAEAMEATRLRIVDAAVELHGSIGPARTTVAGIAARAGVQRHTVYRHFPTDDALLAACSARYWAEHPWPSSAAWAEIAHPAQRLDRALSELHRFYADAAPMLTNVLRDAACVPLVAEAIGTLRSYLDEVVDVLAAGWADGERDGLVRAALRHVTAFGTWQSLLDAGVPAADVGRLLAAVVRTAAES